jgi:IS605 OrfB family transposase
MAKKLRPISAPFVVAAPAGARVRTRLFVNGADTDVLFALGRHLGSLAGVDLARRCREGTLDAEGHKTSRRVRKRSLTDRSSSRWAGAITRTTDDQFQLRRQNLIAEQGSLRQRIRLIDRRLVLPVGSKRGRVRAYASQSERFEKQRRRQVLAARLLEVERRDDEGDFSICRGGHLLAKARHSLNAAGLSQGEWRERWDAERMFITADGEADQRLGNLTIRWDPADESLEIRLPAPLESLANRPHGRYRLSCATTFSHRGDEVAAQTHSGAIRYDIAYDPIKQRWYCDASWKIKDIARSPTLESLRRSPVVALDLNHGHLALCVVDPCGNVVGKPRTIGLELAGLSTTTRDARIRAAISEVLGVAKVHRCRAVVIEDLDFKDSREQGREAQGRRPSRGHKGKNFRRVVSGLPTAKLRDRLVQMASNQGLSVVAVDPAYTSRWGAEHWLNALQEISSDVSGHHAAAVVIARRGLGHRARRHKSGRCDSVRPEDRTERATATVTPSAEAQKRGPASREALGQSHQRHKTRRAKRTRARTQVDQDRSGPPTGRDSVPFSV